jgi:hypothetical protein
MLPLTTADLLAHAIVGSVLENLDMERLVREVGQAVAERIRGNNKSVDEVAQELHEKLLLRNESTKKVVIESIYKESEEAKHNVQVFTQAPSLIEARPLLKKVRHPVAPPHDHYLTYIRFTEHASPTNILHRDRRILAASILRIRIPHPFLSAGMKNHPREPHPRQQDLHNAKSSLTLLRLALVPTLVCSGQL